MRPYKILLAACLLLLTTTTGRAQNGLMKATYVASTPCTANTKPLPGIGANADCELMKWKLVLYTGGNANMFTLHCTYGISRQGSTGFIPGSKEVVMEGGYLRIKGMAGNPNAIVYKLTDSKTGKSISLVRLSDNVLHLLDEGLHLMIGTAAWSYTLNRIDNQ